MHFALGLPQKTWEPGWEPWEPVGAAIQKCVFRLRLAPLNGWEPIGSRWEPTHNHAFRLRLPFKRERAGLGAGGSRLFTCPKPLKVVSMWPQAKIKLVIIPPESDSLVTQLDICRAQNRQRDDVATHVPRIVPCR